MSLLDGLTPDQLLILDEVLATHGRQRGHVVPETKPATKVQGGPGAPRKECGHESQRIAFRRQNGKVYSRCADCHREATRRYRERKKRVQKAMA